MNFIDNQRWRYATKKFDPERKISKDDLEFLLESIRLSASSYGLQPYKVLHIEDPEMRSRIREAAWDQKQVTDASELFIFLHRTEFDPSLVQSFAERKADVNNLNKEKTEAYIDFVNKKLRKKGDKFSDWTARQTYIALANLLAACAERKIDSTPMEGFDQEPLDKTLGIHGTEWSTSVICAVGFRHPDDKAQFQQKVRRQREELFETI